MQGTLLSRIMLEVDSSFENNLLLSHLGANTQRTHSPEPSVGSWQGDAAWHRHRAEQSAQAVLSLGDLLEGLRGWETPF